MGKILNEKHRIATAEMPGEANNFQICYDSADIIIVNSTMPCQEEIVRVMVAYLEQEDDEVRKELYEVVTSEILLGIFHALARVARVRRKLNRSKCA